MENYNASSKAAMQMTFSFFTERRKELKISQKKLAEIVGVSEKTLIANLKQTQTMGVDTYFKLCGALKLRPYLIPAEIDSTEMQRMFFN